MGNLAANKLTDRSLAPNVVWLLGLLLAGFCATQPALAVESHPMRFEHINLDDGLSQSNVLSILQDADGLMWFGTENGLNSYNGYEFDHYMRERGNPNALGSDFIFDMDADAEGNLWLATNGGGLAMLDRNTGVVTSYRHDPENPNSISSDVIRRVEVLKDGTIWIGTRGSGVDRFNPASRQFQNFPLGTKTNIFAIFEDSRGTLWIGGNQGLSRFDETKRSFHTLAHNPEDPASIGAKSVRAIAEDSTGQLWVGTYGDGLSRLDKQRQRFEHFRHDPNDASTLSGDQVTVIFEDQDKRLWVGTTAGLNLIDKETGAAVSFVHDSADPSSIAENSVTTIYEDRTGLLWIGTKTRGVSKWNPRSWAYGFEPVKEIGVGVERQPNVTAFVEDRTGTLWVGTFGEGLNAIDRASGEIIQYRNDTASAYQVNDNRVMSLLEDRAGNLWIGTMANGLSRLDSESGKVDEFQHVANDPRSLSADGVVTLFEDSKGNIWVGTFGGGINRFDPATEDFTRFSADADNPTALSSGRVTSIAEDPSGRLWVGTDGGGLNLFDTAKGTFTAFRHDPNDPTTLAANTVYSLAVDAEGTVWVGTRGGGLDRVVGNTRQLEKIRFANISRRDGLANDVIYGLQVGSDGALWLSTNYGISRFDPATGRIKNLHRNDGLQSEEFNFGAHYQSKAGELFFGGPDGFNAFFPDKIRPNSVIPQVVLTDFTNMTDPVKSGLPTVDGDKGIEISWKDDVVAFEFAALDYASPQNNQYMYKLEGFDKDWVDLGNRRRVTYTDLDDGQYMLRVKAANSDGVWNEAGFAVPISVAAAPWDTWWAYLGYLALVVHAVVAVWLGQRRKIRREEAYTRRLEREVGERTEKLLEKNKQLKFLNDALQESSLSDPLTGLRNRRFVFEEISRDLEVIQRKLNDEDEGLDPRTSSEMVFMMIDLDNFKPINDTYGHAAGDAMLLEFRDVLLSICRRSEFVIRWGGDEFVVIAKQARPGESEALAERIRSTVADHNFTLGDGQIVRTTCSIGFAAYPLFRGQVDNANLDQIISIADGLMYEAKTKRNAWVGMMSPNEASTSTNFDQSDIQPTSLLFRARRAGNLIQHGSDQEREFGLERRQA